MLRTTRCKQCREKFTPEELAKRLILHPHCVDAFATEFAAKQEKKRAAKLKKAQSMAKRVLRERKQAIKTIPDLIKEAQVAFNAFVRTRDAEKPCICCGAPLGRDDIGGAFDAGHYRSTGSASHLRFNEDNCHGQTKRCNRYGAGRAVDYRRGLIERIGLARVEALESSNVPRKWTREELIQIAATYKEKRKQLEKEA